MGGIGVVQDAVAQGLPVLYGPDNMLTVSNAATDGILVDYYGTPYGRESGLDYSYQPGDGRVEVHYSNPGWLRDWEGWQPNVIHLGLLPSQVTSMLDAYADMLITDGTAGDLLMVDNQALGGPTQRGVGQVVFKDGTVWTQAHLMATAGQAVITSPSMRASPTTRADRQPPSSATARATPTCTDRDTGTSR